MSPLQRHFMLVISLTFFASFPWLSSGLTCVCSPDNTNCGKSGTCEVGVGGVCYAQFYSDIFDAHWTVQKGCLTDRSAPVCEHNLSDSHQGGCCSEDMCNAHFELDTNCECTKKCHSYGNHCTLYSSQHSCYTIIRRLGTTITFERGCEEEICEDYEIDTEIRTCCHSDKCNNGSIPEIWPSLSTTVVPSEVTSTPPTADPTDTSAPPTADPTTIEPKQPDEYLLCHCSSCDDKYCVASLWCAWHIVNLVPMTWCVNHSQTCTNNSFGLNCCKANYCNVPSMPDPTPRMGLPCDDEDAEQSGGCDGGLVIPSTASPSSTTTTASATTATTTTTTTTNTMSTKATPTSSSKATPTNDITENSEAQNDDDSNIVIIFYVFTVLLLICIMMMIIVIVACVALMCHYRSIAYNTILSSTTILESTLKEKGHPVNNRSPV